MNLTTAFVDSARKHAAKTAVFCGEEEFSYQFFMRRSAYVAERLKMQFSVQPGNRVALWMKNCPEYIPAFFGVLAAGGVVVPINNFLKPDEVAFILQDAGAQTVIVDSSMREGTDKLALLAPKLRFFRTEDFCEGRLAGDAAGLKCQGSELAVLIYTSGTTGHPKGAMLSHANLLANVESCRQVLAAVDHDRFVVLLPMFHSFMMTVGMLLPLLVGGSMLIIKSVHPPKNVIAEILQKGATILPAVPQFFRALAHAEVPKNFPLRLCISGGAPLPAEILKEFTARMPVPLIEG